MLIRSGLLSSTQLFLIHSFVCPFICSFVHSLIYSAIHSFIHPCTHPFVHSFIPSSVHTRFCSYIQWFIGNVSCLRVRYSQSYACLLHVLPRVLMQSPLQPCMHLVSNCCRSGAGLTERLCCLACTCAQHELPQTLLRSDNNNKTKQCQQLHPVQSSVHIVMMPADNSLQE